VATDEVSAVLAAEAADAVELANEDVTSLVLVVTIVLVF
jgi:hypothetical protein